MKIGKIMALRANVIEMNRIASEISLAIQEKNNKCNEQIISLEKELETSLAVSCDKEFVVDPERTEEFMNATPNSEIRDYNDTTVQKLNINNNNVLDRYMLKKTKKLNKR